MIVPMMKFRSTTVPTTQPEAKLKYRYAIRFGPLVEDLLRHNLHYELHMRMFLLDANEEQQDAFPLGAVVRMDDCQVNLPVRSRSRSHFILF